MRTLTRQEIYRLANDWIGGSGGFLGDFTYSSHREFYPYHCDLDINPDEYGRTTRERFIGVLENSDSIAQSKIIRGVLTKYPAESADGRSKQRHAEWLRIADELTSPQTSAARETTARKATTNEIFNELARRNAKFVAPLMASEKQTSQRPEVPRKGERREMDTVFVVHGRNRKISKELFRLLRALHLKPLEWNSLIEMTGKATPHISEILDTGFANAAAVVVLFTPDDVGRLREEFLADDDPEADRKLSGQARLNVVFEAGLAFGTHPERTVLVQVGSVRPFSDLAGRHVVKLGNSARSRKELATKLRNAGCSVDESGTDWLEEGDFEP